jgi:hypothetical protein
MRGIKMKIYIELVEKMEALNAKTRARLFSPSDVRQVLEYLHACRQAIPELCAAVRALVRDRERLDAIPECACGNISPTGNVCGECVWKGKYIEARSSGYQEGKEEMQAENAVLKERIEIQQDAVKKLGAINSELEVQLKAAREENLLQALCSECT